MTSSLSLIGAVRPRVEVAPSFAYTLGDEAAALAELAGLRLEPWQREGLATMLSVREDGQWAAFEYVDMVARQNGKTALLMARALAGLFLLGERLILWSAHEYKTAMRSFAELRNLLHTLGTESRPNVVDVDDVLVKINNTNGEESFERLDTGQMIKLVARSKGSGRGFATDCLMIDEAFAYTAMQQSALMPTLNARPNPQILYASSPPLDRWSGEPLFALRKRALAGAADGLAYRDWGIELDLDAILRLPESERDVLLDDPELWAAANPALGRGRVSYESILRNRRSMSPESFAREILGAWPVPAAEAGGLILPSVWSELADVNSQFPGRPVFAVDASQDHATASIAAAGRRADELAHVELLEERPGQGMAWVPDRCVELQDRHDPMAWVIDPTGPAGPLIVELQARGIEPVLVGGREYVQACGEFYDAVTAATLRHRGQVQLDTAVRAARPRDVGDGAWAWARRGSITDIGRVVAATLAHHGLLVFSPRAYDVLESVW